MLDNKPVSLVAMPHPFAEERIVKFAVEGLTIKQLLDMHEVKPVDGSQVLLDGYPVHQDQWAFVIPQGGQLVTFRNIPQGGGGGKNPLRTILTIAVIAAAWYAPPLILGNLGFVASSAAMLSAATAVTAGIITTVGMLAVNAIAPPPKPTLDSLTGNDDAILRSPSLYGGRNSLTPYGVVPKILGRAKIIPPFAGKPYTEIAGNDQYLHALFMLGLGEISASNFKIGDTAFSSFSDIQYTVFHNNNGNQPEFPYYKESVDEAPIDILLQGDYSKTLTGTDATNSNPTTLSCAAALFVEQQIAAGNTIVNSRTNEEVSVVSVDSETSITHTTLQDDWQSGDTFTIKRYAISTTAPNTKEAVVEVTFKSGLAYANDDGSYGELKVELSAEYSQAGRNVWSAAEGVKSVPQQTCTIPVFSPRWISEDSFRYDRIVISKFDGTLHYLKGSFGGAMVGEGGLPDWVAPEPPAVPSWAYAGAKVLRFHNDGGVTDQVLTGTFTTGAHWTQEIHTYSYDTFVDERSVNPNITGMVPSIPSPYNYAQLAETETDTSVFFKPDGNKMFVLRDSGVNKAVAEYTLTSFDLSTLSYVGEYVLSQVLAGEGRAVFFSGDGTKLYVTDADGGQVHQYALGTAWLISSVSFAQTKSLSNLTPHGLCFSSDGTKMLVSGSWLGTPYIRRYSLSPAWDISTATQVSQVKSQYYNTTGVLKTVLYSEIRFANSGLYLFASDGYTLVRYALPTNWDWPSSASMGFLHPRLGSCKVWGEVSPSFYLDDAGEKLFLLQSTGNVFLIPTLVDYEIPAIANSVRDHVTFSAGTIQAAFGIQDKRVGTIRHWWPINFPVSGQYDIRFRRVTAERIPNRNIDDVHWTVLRSLRDTQPVTFSGSATYLDIRVRATDQLNGSLDSVSCVVQQQDQKAYTPASGSITQPSSNPADIYYDILTGPENKKFVSDAEIDLDKLMEWKRFCAGAEYALSGAASPVGSGIVSGQDDEPRGLFFSADGTKMYILGNETKKIYQYTLSTAWNEKTATYSGKSLAYKTGVTEAWGLSFSSSGDCLYYIDANTANLQQYALGTPWDIETESFVGQISVSAGAGADEVALYFNPDGSKLYVLYKWNSGRYVSRYTLGTPWAISSKSLDYSTIATGGSAAVTGLFFSSDGTYFYLCEPVGKVIIRYTAKYAWDTRDGSNPVVLSISNQEESVTSLFFHNSTDMFLVGEGSRIVYRYNLGTAWDISTAVNYEIGGTSEFVSLQVSGHELTAGELVEIANTNSYNGIYIISAVPDNNTIIIPREYIAEDFDEHARAIKPGYQFNQVIDYKTSVDDILREVSAAGRASISYFDGKRSVIIDQPQTTPRQHFTPRNSWDFSSHKIFFNPIHAFRVRFPNRFKDWREDELLVYADTYNESNATVIEQLQLPGVDLPSLAFKHARYHMATAQLRPEVYTFNCDIENLVVTRGDLIRVTHDVPLWGTSTGRIKSVVTDAGNVTAVTFDETITVDSANDYCFRTRKTSDNSTRVDNVIVTVSGDYSTFTLETPVLIADAPAVGDLVLFGIQGQESAELLIKSITPNQDLTARIEAVDYSAGVYTADTQPIPLFNSKITKPLYLADAIGPPVIEGVISDESVLEWSNLGILNSRIKVVFSWDSGYEKSAVDKMVVYFEYRPTEVENSGAIAGMERNNTERTQVVVQGFQREVFSPTVRDGERYLISAQYILKDGTMSVMSAEVAETVIGKTTVPSAPTNVVATGRSEAIEVKWDNSPELDVRAVEIYRNTTNSIPGTSFTALVVKPSEHSVWLDTSAIVGTTYYYWLKTLDYARLKSAATASVSTVAVYAEDVQNVDGVPANVVANYSTSNDNDGSAIADASAVSLSNVKTNTDGSVDLKVVWLWGGANADIDGFRVVLYASDSSSAYTIGTTPANETKLVTAPDKREYTAFGVPANRYYTVGILPYRVVNATIDADCVIEATNWASNGTAFRPSSSVDYTGSVGGTAASSVAETVTIVTTSDRRIAEVPRIPSIPFGGVAIDYVQNDNGSVNIGVEWGFDEAPFDLSAVVEDSFVYLGGTESAISGVWMKPDGTVLYILGKGTDTLRQFTLSPAFDVSTAQAAGSLSVSGVATNPSGYCFSDDGVYLFFTDPVADKLVRYTLGQAWDVTSASLSENISASRKAMKSFYSGGQIVDASSLWFSPDGGLLFCHKHDGYIIKYGLSDAWNISTAAYAQSSSVTMTGDSLCFSPSGDKVWVCELNKVYTRSMSTPWDLSTLGTQTSRTIDYCNCIRWSASGLSLFLMTYGPAELRRYTVSSAFDIGSTLTNTGEVVSFWAGSSNVPQDFFISDDGTKLFVRMVNPVYGVEQFTLLNPWQLNSVTYANKRAIWGYSGSIYANYGLFVGDGGRRLFVINGITDYVYQYWLRAAWDLQTFVKHPLTCASAARAATNNDADGFTFSNDGSKLFWIGGRSSTGTDIFRMSLSIPWDVQTLEYDEGYTNFIQSGSSYIFNSVFVNPSGTKLYALSRGSGSSYCEIRQYDLGVAFDIRSSSATLVYTLNVYSWETGPEVVLLSADGTRVYIGGYTTDRIHQITLNTAWELSSYEYLNNGCYVGSQTGVVKGACFAPDGKILYVLGDNDTVFQYSVGTAWDLQTANYSGKSLNVNSYDDGCVDVRISADGSKLYINGTSGFIHQYTLMTPFDVSTATAYDGIADCFVGDSGAKLFLVGSSKAVVESYDLGTPYSLSSVSAHSSGSVNLVNTEAIPTTVFIGLSGQYLFVSGLSNTVYRYGLGTLYNLATAELLDEYDSSVELSSITDSWFSGDGRHMVLVDGVAGNVFGYTFDATDDSTVISGYILHGYSAPTDPGEYVFGTTPAKEFHIIVPSADINSYAITGVSPNDYYVFGVQSFRYVDSDIPGAVGGMLVSDIAYPRAIDDERPYLPTTDVVFSGVEITGTVGDIATENLTSGTYTPVLFGVLNISGSTPYLCQYTRVGATATVSGKIGVTPTAGGEQTELGISLPFVSRIGEDFHCAGVAVNPADTESAAILGDAVGNRATMRWVATDTSLKYFFFTFTYQIIDMPSGQGELTDGTEILEDGSSYLADNG